LRARVERGEGADDARLALRDHQLRIGDDELRRADRRQTQLVEQWRQRHHSLLVALGVACGDKRVDAAGASSGAKMAEQSPRLGEPADEADWRALVEQGLKGAQWERLVGRTGDGLTIEPLYREPDMHTATDVSG